MWRITALAILLAVPGLAGAGDFTPYYGKGEVIEGKGGTMEVVDGVEFWKSGTPPMRYEVIGYIDDTRKVTGWIGKLNLKAQGSKVAKLAKEHGGDAVIAESSTEAPAGLVGSGNTATVVVARSTRFAVIRYVE